MTRLRRTRKVGDFFLAHTPRIVISDTYQVMLATALLAMGVITLIALLTGESTGAITHTLTSNVLRIMWGVSLAAGGAGQLLGIQKSDRDIERFGITLSMIGSAVYAFALYTQTQTYLGLIFAVVFTAFALAYALVLYVSSVAKRIDAS